MLWLAALVFFIAGYLTRAILEKFQHERQIAKLRTDAKEAIVAGVMEGLDDLALAALTDGPPTERPEVTS